MKILAIIGLLFVAWMFVDEIKTLKWRGVLLCVDVTVIGLINAFSKELKLEGMRLTATTIGVVAIVPLGFSLYPEVRTKIHKVMQQSKQEKRMGKFSNFTGKFLRKPE